MCVILYKYHSSGDDYLVYDCSKNSGVLGSENIQMICSTNFGLGFDGVMIGPTMKEDGMHVRMFNPDGSETKSSRKNLSIFARYLKDAGYIMDDSSVVLQTMEGPVQIQHYNETGSVYPAGKMIFADKFTETAQ